MSQTEDVILALGKTIVKLQGRVDLLEEALISLQRGLVNAFKETGFDFSKIGQIEPSRRAVVSNDPDFVDVAISEDKFTQKDTTQKIFKNEPRQDGDVCPI
jgi:hypothetical protein